MMRGLMPWPVKGAEPAPGHCVPSLDLAETGDSLIATLEVPGLERRDIEIAPQEKRREPQARYHHAERACGVFARRLRLPVAVDAARVTVTVKNGLLTVTLPKTRAGQGTQIPIAED